MSGAADGKAPAAGAGRLARLAKLVTGVPLFVKIMGIALLLTTLFGAQTIISSRALLRESLEKEAGERSCLLVRQLESSLTEPLITGDLVHVSGLLAEAEEIYPDVEYSFVISPHGRVLVGPRTFQLSGELAEANAVGPDGAIGMQLFDTELGLIGDFAAPIMNGRLGTLRIGISREQAERAVRAMTVRLLNSFLLVALAGVLISYGLAYILNRPINELIKGIDRVEKGDLDVAVRPWFDDEIGRLTSAFNNMAAALQRKKALKTELVRKLVASQEEERVRISRELHDKTAQSLASIKIGLKVMEQQGLPAPALEKFAELRALLNGTLDGIHELAVELRPPALADLGLPQAVTELGENFGRDFGVEVACSVDDCFRERRLAPELEIGLYRIIQEAFSNIEKHSAAGRVELALRQRPGGIALTIRDDGAGFDPAQVSARAGRKPIGLFGMRERAEILGGTFSITSSPGAGTGIEVLVPAAA